MHTHIRYGYAVRQIHLLANSNAGKGKEDKEHSYENALIAAAAANHALCMCVGFGFGFRFRFRFYMQLSNVLELCEHAFCNYFARNHIQTLVRFYFEN